MILWLVIIGCFIVVVEVWFFFNVGSLVVSDGILNWWYMVILVLVVVVK